ncbi:hypothetical protein EON64_00845 [archaeon]|nr:MAG: hypothetical protein EON64_00845 [archaeon]
MLQADLESTVETLSDVVARRRLRAAEKQIIQATRAAKQKRVEFESLIIAYSSAKLSALHSEAATPSRQATPGSVNSRFRTSTPSRSATRSGSTGTRRRHEWLSRGQDNDADGLDDMAALLLNLEFQDRDFLNILRTPARSAANTAANNTAVDDNISVIEDNNGLDTAANADADSDVVRTRLANVLNNNDSSATTPSSLSNAMNELRQRRRQAQLSGNVSTVPVTIHII